MAKTGTAIARSRESEKRGIAALVRSHITFYTHAVRDVYQRSKWRGLMEATRQTTKTVWAIFISAGGIGVLAIFVSYLWPLLGKRWWGIIFLQASRIDPSKATPGVYSLSRHFDVEFSLRRSGSGSFSQKPTLPVSKI